MKMFFVTVAVCLVTFFAMPVCAASSQDDGASVLLRAKEQFKLSHYDSCSSIIRSFLKAHGDDKASESLVPLLIETSVRLGDFALSRRLFQIYQKKYPVSVFTPRLWYCEAAALVHEKDFAGALGAYSRALTGGVTAELDTLIIANTQKLCAKAMTVDEIDALVLRGDLHARIVEILLYCELTRLNEAGQSIRAFEMANQFLKKYPQSAYAAVARDVVSKVNESQKGVIQIGVLAPLSGPDTDIGKLVTQGMQIAFDQYAASSGARLRLVICDTKSSLIETAKKTRELCSEHHVPVILGPMLSHDAVVAASVVADKDVVLLSPTATDDGIASLGPNIFQMNTTLAVLGAKIARYAIDNLNIQEFAIMAPTADYASALTAGFKAEVAKSGREIVDEESFEEGTHDFKEQFDKLKTKLVWRQQQKTVVEKSLNGEAIPQQPAGKKPDVKAPDTTYEIGGLFVPVEAEDAAMIAGQTQFHKIKTQLLGSVGWHNQKTIINGKEYVSDALLSSNLPLSDAVQPKEWLTFATAYKGRYNTDPDRIAALGYDAASLIVSIMRTTGSQPLNAVQIAQALAKVKEYQGATGAITIDPVLRINTEAAILKIRDKQFIRVQ